MVLPTGTPLTRLEKRLATNKEAIVHFIFGGVYAKFVKEGLKVCLLGDAVGCWWSLNFRRAGAGGSYEESKLPKGMADQTYCGRWHHILPKGHYRRSKTAL